MATTTYGQTEHSAARTSGFVMAMRWMFITTMGLLIAMALGQLFLAGLAIFDAPARWADHANSGHIFGLVTYVVWIFAALGRMGWKVVTGALVLMVIAHLQYMFLGIDNGVVNALHPLNGSLILVTCLWLLQMGVRAIRRKH